jgi:hypothetical protein
MNNLQKPRILLDEKIKKIRNLKILYRNYIYEYLYK